MTSAHASIRRSSALRQSRDACLGQTASVRKTGPPSAAVDASGAPAPTARDENSLMSR